MQILYLGRKNILNTHTHTLKESKRGRQQREQKHAEMPKVDHDVTRLCEHGSEVCDVGADGTQALAVLSAAAPVRPFQR